MQQKPYALGSLNYLLPGPFQGKHVDFYFREWWLSLWWDRGSCHFGGQSWSTIRHTLVSKLSRTSLQKVQVIQLLSGRTGDKLMPLWFQVCKSNRYKLPLSREGLSPSDCYQPRHASQVFLLEGQEECHPFWRNCSLEPFVQRFTFAAMKPLWGWLWKSNIFSVSAR